MRYKELLVEHIVNLHSPEEKERYANTVWDMLTRSYEKIGGFKSAVNVDDLINTPGYWKLVRRNGRITAVSIYRKSSNTRNFKKIASATETERDPVSNTYKATTQGLRDHRMITVDDLKTKRCWAEVSGPAETVYFRLGAVPIDNRFAGVLTGKEILSLDQDHFHYTRLIQGAPVVKVIVGFPYLSEEGIQELVKNRIDVHELPDNIQF